ncbi:hypothetical protein D3C73_891550 [compost metagenome]
MSLVAKNQGVNMILNLFFGTMINASYGIAMQVQGAVNQFVSNFQTALNPQIIQNYAGGNKEKSVSLMFLGAKFSFLLMMILVFPLIFNVETILKIWLGHVPEYTSLFIKISLITILIDSLSGPLMTGILATGKIKYYNVIIGSFNILTLPCSYILLKLGFPPTVAFQILLTFSVFSFLLRFFLVKKEFQINISDFFKKVFLRIIATVGFLILCIYLLSKSTFLMENIFINVPIIILNAIFAILSFGISNNERGHILSILRSKIRRKNDK